MTGLFKRFQASSVHNKVAVGFVVLGILIGIVILTMRYQGLDSRDPQFDASVELGELSIVALAFLIAAVVKLDEWRIRRQREREREEFKREHPHLNPEE